MSDKPAARPQNPQLTIKISEEMQRGVYANRVVIGHTRDEFVFDFIAELPPGPCVVGRIITAPAHAAALLEALAENVARYEKDHGAIRRGAPPLPPPQFSA
ncbi:MAG: DUF3467 domain-containing protein [Acidobacteria bacterium]|jgi:hypothetical protein|nr:DUF3467 domain-containing protein [Acidobacteriota bacterium]MCU0254432.1 DUF3467 domain-containing protein [Acidobacteriota bacterium]